MLVRCSILNAYNGSAVGNHGLRMRTYGVMAQLSPPRLRSCVRSLLMYTLILCAAVELLHVFIYACRRSLSLLASRTTSSKSKEFCDQSIGRPLPELIRREEVCGRPLGLRFCKETGDLYIADAYFGILRVGAEGGQAQPLVSHDVQGQPLTFTNDLDIASDGSVYFTDSSSKYQRRNFLLLVLSGDDSGRVLKYHPESGETSVVIKGLQFPNGVVLSKDESFLVIAESVPCRLLRHWLKGDKAGETEVLAMLPGPPDNVRMNEEGELWVAMHCRRNWVSRLSGALPWLRRAFLQLPIPFKHVYRIFNGITPHGILAKYSATSGDLLDILEDVSGHVVKYASEVDEHDGRLWIGSVLLPYISVYDIHSSLDQS